VIATTPALPVRQSKTFPNGRSGPFRLRRIRGLESSLGAGFLERTRFPHNLTACYQVLPGPEWRFLVAYQ
jgi:hypothetical protein